MHPKISETVRGICATEMVETYDVETQERSNVGGIRSWGATLSQIEANSSSIMVNDARFLKVMKDLNASFVTLCRAATGTDGLPLRVQDRRTGEERHQLIHSCALLVIPKGADMDDSLARLYEAIPEVEQLDIAVPFETLLQEIPEAGLILKAARVPQPFVGTWNPTADQCIFLMTPSGVAQNGALWTNRKRAGTADQAAPSTTGQTQMFQ